MEITKKTIDDVGIIKFNGKTLGEPADSKEFENQLNELIDSNVKKIVLDLEEVERINSTGLAILITATTLFTDCGGQNVVLAGSNDFINGALAVTKLSNFFDCYSSVDEALEKMQHVSC